VPPLSPTCSLSCGYVLGIAIATNKVGAFCLEEQKVIDVIQKKQGKERSNIRQIKRKKSDWFNIYFMKNFRSPVSLCKSLPSKRRSWLPLTTNIDMPWFEETEKMHICPRKNLFLPESELALIKTTKHDG